ncbi:MAG: DNA gyrase inhibitor YacG [Rhodobacter sp.]|nr:DNA gyrase inhibitor YacG [Rhodobacter sp.]
MTCPICGKAASPDYRPFCSRRCADVDLGRWLTESYRIPAKGDEAEEGGDDSTETPPGAGPH